jgi:hypothetical protein
MGIKIIGCESVDWIHLAQNRIHWRAVVNTVMNMTSWTTVSFSRRNCFMEIFTQLMTSIAVRLVIWFDTLHVCTVIPQWRTIVLLCECCCINWWGYIARSDRCPALSVWGLEPSRARAPGRLITCLLTGGHSVGQFKLWKRHAIVSMFVCGRSKRGQGTDRSHKGQPPLHGNTRCLLSNLLSVKIYMKVYIWRRSKPPFFLDRGTR